MPLSRITSVVAVTLVLLSTSVRAQDVEPAPPAVAEDAEDAAPAEAKSDDEAKSDEEAKSDDGAEATAPDAPAAPAAPDAPASAPAVPETVAPASAPAVPETVAPASAPAAPVPTPEEVTPPDAPTAAAEPEPTPPPPKGTDPTIADRRLVAYVASGVALVALGAGVGLGVFALDGYTCLEDVTACNARDGVEPIEGQDFLERKGQVETTAVFADMAYVVAAAATVVAVTGYIRGYFLTGEEPGGAE